MGPGPGALLCWGTRNCVGGLWGLGLPRSEAAGLATQKWPRGMPPVAPCGSRFWLHVLASTRCRWLWRGAGSSSGHAGVRGPALSTALLCALVLLLQVEVVTDGGEEEIELDDSPGAAWRLDVGAVPLVLSVSQVGGWG